MKLIPTALLVLLCGTQNLVGDSFGPMSYDIDSETWTKVYESESTGESPIRILVLADANTKRSVTLMRSSSPVQFPLEDFAAGIARGIVKSGGKVIATGFTEIHGVRFAHTEWIGSRNGVDVYGKTFSTIVANHTYQIGLGSPIGAPGDDADIAAFLQSMKFKSGEPGATDNPGDAQ